MTAQSTEPPRSGPDNSFGPYAQVVGYQGIGYQGNSFVVVVDEAPPTDPTVRDIELPQNSPLFRHLATVAGLGGVVYLTAFGRRVAAVVPADVAESMERTDEDVDPGAGLRELLAEAEARLGPVPPEIAAEVDRQWDAALASM